MNHKHSASHLFPTWYKSIDPLISLPIAESRISAINKLLVIDELSFWLDVVRMAFKLKPIANVNSDNMVNEFREADVNFPLTSNENLMTVLSRIILCFLFESSRDKRDLIAEAVRNIVFFGQFESSDIPFYRYACEVLTENDADENINIADSRTVLEKALEALEENVGEDENINLDDVDNIAIIKSVDFLFRQNLRLKEETNVLWWLFGSYSTLHDSYFQEVGAVKMILSAPKELADFSRERNRFLSAKHFLAKVLTIANGGKNITKKYNISTVISSAPIEFRNNVLLGLAAPTELTPCLYALFLSTQFDDPALWRPMLEKKIKGVAIDEPFKAVEIAFQIYNEILFLSHLES